MQFLRLLIITLFFLPCALKTSLGGSSGLGDFSLPQTPFQPRILTVPETEEVKIFERLVQENNPLYDVVFLNVELANCGREIYYRGFFVGRPHIKPTAVILF